MCKPAIAKISAEVSQSLKTLILLDPANNKSYQGGPVTDNDFYWSASQMTASVCLCLMDLVLLKDEQKDDNDWKAITDVLDISIPQLMKIINELGDRFKRIQAFNPLPEYLAEACKELDSKGYRKHRNLLLILFGAIYQS